MAQYGNNNPRSAGIRSLGLKLPEYFLRLEELARLRGVDPQKYLQGLLCKEMAVAPPQATIVPYMVAAVEQAMAKSPVGWEELGMIVVGSESGLDHSRPLSSFILEALGKKGRMQSFEVKHACYAGTVALLHALYWVRSGANQGRSALVVCGDLARYAPRHPGEPTQGGGAVAMIVGEGKEVAEISPHSWAYTEPQWDFYKPLEQPYPQVDGPLSLDCYIRACEACVEGYVEEQGLEHFLSADALCFHVPYPKMVYKALQRLKERFGIPEDRYRELLTRKVEPFLRLNSRMGNAYTGSLWFSVATALHDLPPSSRILAFSYGSGFGSELLEITVGEKPEGAYWYAALEEELSRREEIPGETYEAWREEEQRLFCEARMRALNLASR